MLPQRWGRTMVHESFIGGLGLGLLLGALILVAAYFITPESDPAVTCDLGGNKTLTIEVDNNQFTPPTEPVQNCTITR